MNKKQLKNLPRTAKKKGPWMYLVAVPCINTVHPHLEPVRKVNAAGEHYFNLVVDYSKEGPYRPRPPIFQSYIHFLDINGEPRSFSYHDNRTLMMVENGYICDTEESWRSMRIRCVNRCITSLEKELEKEVRKLREFRTRLHKARNRPRSTLKDRIRISLDVYQEDFLVQKTKVSELRDKIRRMHEKTSKLWKGEPVPKIDADEKLIG